MIWIKSALSIHMSYLMTVGSYRYLYVETLYQNGGDFNILLSTFKLALLASFVVRYSFENLTQERGCT